MRKHSDGGQRHPAKATEGASGFRHLYACRYECSGMRKHSDIRSDSNLAPIVRK